MNRVVITGIGVISPVGPGPREFWTNLTAGRSGIGAVTLFDASTFPVRIAGEASGFDAASVAAAFEEVADVRDRKVPLALAAATDAIGDAGQVDGALADGLLCFGVGLESFCLADLTAHAGAADLEAAVAAAALGDGSDVLLQTPLDRAADVLGGRYGFGRGRWVNCSACAAGAQAIGEAWQALREGHAEIALAGAADSMLNPLGMGGFSLLRVLSDENDHPETACRPFDATRRGTVLGEGAAFLVMETADRARRRGVRAYAEVLGYGTSMDAYRVSDPDPTGRGAVRSMAAALASADLMPDDVDCISAHGTGTPKNDVVETAAIRAVLGDRADRIPVHAVKSMTGHLIAASGAVEAAAAAMTIHDGRIPPTINLTCPDGECDLDYTAGRSRPFAGKTVLSNSFGFGGQNATLIFGRTD